MMVKKAWICLGIIALLLIAGVAYASIPGPDGVIHGCYKNNNPAQGAVIVVDHTASCPSGYTALNWNQTGPQGPAGPASLAVLDVAMATPVSVTPGTSEQGVQSCPSQGGYVAIGGGVDTDLATSPDLDQLSAGVNNGGGANLAWVVRMYNHGSVTREFRVHVFCVVGTVQYQ